MTKRPAVLTMRLLDAPQLRRLGFRGRPQPVSRDAVVKLNDHPYAVRCARGGVWLIWFWTCKAIQISHRPMATV